VKQPVPLELAKLRALMYLNKHVGRLEAASNVAHSIWPDTQFRAQGAGGAASRILKALAVDGMAVWTVDHNGGRWVDSGWAITSKGRRHVHNRTS
jgi:hypothetical protein